MGRGRSARTGAPEPRNRDGRYDDRVPLRAIDFHVHLPTPDWLDVSMAGYVEAAEAYFRSPVQRQSLEDLAARYRDLRVKAVLLAWDAETATGRPRVPNETVAQACRDYPGRVHRAGLGRPAQGRGGRRRGGEHRRTGVARGQVPPLTPGLLPNDPSYWPIFEACQQHGLLALFHTGTSGIGPASPAGRASGWTTPTRSSSTRWPPPIRG